MANDLHQYEEDFAHFCVKVQVQVEPKKYFFKNLCMEPPFRILAPPPLIVNYFVKSPLFYFNTIIMIQ